MALLRKWLTLELCVPIHPHVLLGEFVTENKLTDRNPLFLWDHII